jgi:DNA replication and repair protein RecF
LRIRTLRLTNFRNFGDITVEFGERRNVILGGNAEGKTNVLDAVHILGVGRSHRERREANLVKFGEEFYRIEGVFDQKGVKTVIEVAFGAEGKRIRINGKEARGSDLIGLAAVVITCPDDIGLVKGSPLGRRRFIDIAMCQMNRGYLRDLQQYYRVLAQRNMLFRKGGESRAGRDAAVWDKGLVDAGEKVVGERVEFLKMLSPMVKADYNTISGELVEISVAYQPRGYRIEGTRGIADGLRAAMEKNRENEAARGYSLVGPHVDDFSFLIGGRDMRQFGSEGEQRTAVLALRCAEARAIEERLEKPPIVLLDDVFAELDENRSAALISLIARFDQIILTASRSSPLGAENVRRIHVERGRVRYDG